MALDTSLRKQLVQAREVILAEIEEIECSAKDSVRGDPPEFGSPYAELKEQLSEIDDLLGTNGISSGPAAPDNETGDPPGADENSRAFEAENDEPPPTTPVQELGTVGNTLARNVIVDPESGSTMKAAVALGAGLAFGVGLGAATRNLSAGIGMGAALGAALAAIARRFN